MEMEFMAEFTEGMSRDRARQIIKGKRTKRQRPNSPLATSATSGDCLIDNYNKSPVMSTKEDEDMANCLIMLARSVYPVTEEEYSDIQIRQKTAEKLKLTSVVKSSFYVYECKTCNRTFPSFQALGGHRASHKKPKVINNNNNNIIIPPPLIEFVEEDNNNSNSNKLDLDQQKTVTEDDENKASINITNITNNINSSNSKGKVHECSICGSEFLSGQALGGHMRKHRPIPPTSGNRTGISTTSDDITADRITEKSSTSSCMLSLDLNFPPPEVVDELHQSPFQFTAGGSSQPHLMFSAPPFVDCHY